jgi:hypothetical protein
MKTSTLYSEQKKKPRLINLLLSPRSDRPRLSRTNQKRPTASYTSLLSKKIHSQKSSLLEKNKILL